MEYNTLIVLAGTGLLGACSGLIGTFAVLRRRALTGDALAHAALPGLCLAFLVVGERSLPAMLAGAFLMGILSVALIAALRDKTRVKEDAAIGIVLSVFFGLGVVLLKIIQNQSSTGSKAGLNSYILGRTSGMAAMDVYLIAGVAVACLITVVLFFKEFRLIAFDPQFAQTGGWPVYSLDLLLMILITVTVVISLPAIGVVMVTALLVLPAASARFWTERLSTMLIMAAFFGVLMAMAGTLLSARFRLATGPIIALVGMVVFLGSVLCAPRRGGLAMFLDQRRFRSKLADQAFLRFLYDESESELPECLVLTLSTLMHKGRRTNQLGRTLQRLQSAALVESPEPGQYQLTDEGLSRAVHITRNYRAWELFLTEYADQAGNIVDLDTDSLEAILPESVVEELESKLRAQGRWPEVSLRQ